MSRSGVTLTLICVALTVGAMALALTTPQAPTLSGTARVIDGDTITISGTHIRLHGIDAPESSQTCTRKAGTWACGLAATAVLTDLVRGKSTTCRARGLDSYGRTLAVCFTGSLNINARMVRDGYARAFYRYSWQYVLEETLARFSGVGIWQGTSQAPWEYRASRRAAAR
jgi:endonuclease YncB( thermonuclease family)